MKSLKNFCKSVCATIGVLLLATYGYADPTWTRVNYTSSTAFIGIVKINDYDNTFPMTVSEGDYIGAFVGDECRMIAPVFSYDGKLYVSSVIQGGEMTDMTSSTASEPEEVEFKVWNHTTNKLVDAQVKGTLFTKSAGEIFDYEIGKPNTGSELESLQVASYSLSPAFSSDVTNYTISVAFGTTLPSVTDYVAVAKDSRATYSVSEATAYDANGKATSTITVTAEDGTKTTYNVTFVQEACPVVAPTTDEIVVKTFCQGDDVSIKAMFGGKSEVAVWYSVATGGTPIEQTNQLDLGKKDAGQYDYYVAKYDGTCESTGRLKVTLTVNDKPNPQILGLKDTYCSNDGVVTLEASLSGGVFTVNGEAATSFDPSKAKSGANAIEYTIDNDGCEGSDSKTVEVTTQPTVSLDVDLDMCSADEPQTLKATPATGEWTGDGVTKSGSSYVFTPTKSSSLVYTYTEGACSVVKTATITVANTPKPLINGLNDSYCKGDAAVSLSADPVGGVFMLGGKEITSFNPADAEVGNNTLSYKIVVSGCEGIAEKTIAVVASPEIDLSGVPQKACVGEVVSLTPTVGTWKGTGVSGTSFTSTGDGTYSLTYSETKNGCSASESVDILVVKADAPSVTSATVEMNGTVPALQASGSGSINWYDSQTGTSLKTGASYTPSVSTATETVYTYYVSNTENNCESEKVPVTLTVTSCTTEAPTIAKVDPVCEGSAFPTLTAVGTNITWYDAITGGKSLATGSTYVPTAAGTYYASQNPGCEGSRASVKVEVKAKPSAPEAQGAVSCEGAELVAMTSTESVNWYVSKTSAAVATDAKSYTPSSLSATTTFYVNRTENGCASDFSEVVYTIKPNPSAPTVDTRRICFDNDYDYYVRVTGGTVAGGTLQWYDDKNLPLGTETIQNVTVPATITETTIIAYTVSQTVDQCTSPMATAMLYVNPLPQPKITGLKASYCSDSNERVTLSADLTPGDFMLDNSFKESFVPSQLKAGIHEVSYTYEDANGCYGEVEAQFSVEDCSAPDVQILTLNTSSITLKKNQTYSDFSVQILPADAPQTVQWSTSDPSVVTVDLDGTLHAVGVGDAIVTVASTYTESKKAQCMVKVVAPAEAVVFTNAEPLTVDEGGFIDLSKYMEIKPEKASVESITWTLVSSDATISKDGVLTAGIVSADVDVEVSVKVTSVDGSTVSGKVVVSIIKTCSLSAPTVANATQSICVGDGPVTFTASGDASADWIWLDASDKVIGETNSYKTETAGTYYVYQRFGDCAGAKTKVSLTVNELPQISITFESSYCSDESVIVSFPSSVPGTVFKLDGVEKTSFNPSQMSIGTHTIDYSYTDNNGCTGSDQAVFTIDDCSLPPVTSVVLSESVLTLEKGKTAKLTTTIKPAESPQTVSWKSSNPAVATVDANGNIVAVGRGTATITATSTYTSSQSASCSVTVLSPLTDVSFNYTGSISLMEGKSTNVSPYLVINPSDAVIQSVVWSSSSNVVTVVDGMVTAGSVAAETTVTITATVTSAEGVVKTATIPVVVSPFSIDLSALNKKIVEAMQTIAEKESIKGENVGNIPPASFEILQNAINQANSMIANPPSEQSTVDAQTILLNSAIKDFLNSEIPNKVSDISFEETVIHMVVGEEFTPKAIFAPQGAHSDLIWSSSNSDVVRVYGSGRVVAQKAGSVAVTAALPTNMTISARLIIIVSEAPKLLSVSMNKLGNQLEFLFTEKMAEPDPEVYTDLYAYGNDVAIYNVMDIYVDKKNPKKLIAVIGGFIDDPTDVCIVYRGKSIKSVDGGVAEGFDYFLGKTAITDVAAEQIIAYPSIATTSVIVAGISAGNRIAVVSAKGNVVDSRIATADSEEINVSRFVAGTYYVIVYNGNAIVSRIGFVKK
ncbi:MAG: Ig-like domain-containing protein [Bacteroidales bacterium]|nr:Ig-like domain-containing protein [Bacteroidales bacterium]